MADKCKKCRSYEKDGKKCHRYPPTPNWRLTGLDTTTELVFDWPTTEEDEWCSEYVEK